MSDFIIVGSGAGGSAAAGYLTRHGQDFVWLEAGDDESQRLVDYSAIDPQSMPTQNWSPTRLKTLAEREIPYTIPLTTGGMTSHYAGVMYWTMNDTIESLKVKDEEREVLEYVLNNTAQRVVCDAMDERYHTHARDSHAPAPDASFTSLPLCMYGECKGDAARCQLNKYFASAVLGIEPPASIDAWHRGSAFQEYASDAARAHLKLQHRVHGLVVDNDIVRGVQVHTSSGNTTACARHGVILSAGVMGNANILHALTDAYQFFGQPVLVVVDYAIVSGMESCDADTTSGGTFHKADDHGFLSTFVICKVNGSNRLVFASPQAISSRIHGTVHTKGSPVASINYDDATALVELKRDVERAAFELFGINMTVPDELRFEYAGYHWSGHESDVHHSRFRDYRNLFVGDAMGITGTTHGWTSFNARVAGALAARRAMEHRGDSCRMLKSDYQYDGCCAGEASPESCRNTKTAFESLMCCA